MHSPAVPRRSFMLRRGAWQRATITDGKDLELARIFDWSNADPGEHAVPRRATAAAGEVQPKPAGALFTGKTTYGEYNGQIARRVRIV